MRKNIRKVLEAFRYGSAANGDSKRTCSTDGKAVFSYNMKIAERDSHGLIKIVPYAKGPSRTTRSQISAARSMFPEASDIE